MWKMYSALCSVLIHALSWILQNFLFLKQQNSLSESQSVFKDQLSSSYTAFMNTTAHLHISLTVLL